ncbi:sensor histidine kinase [Frankia sp. AiPa1]|uniref:sensor histidine kinase n=1 Tax=Frankia sp. AiPa1 TaxID=573492 RepID=UPI00202B7A7E|nr:histidine kinase [Frankia sp. AiPa1]MCL9761192.1 histidine kinase [Frankia sp. AiPa1]
MGRMGGAREEAAEPPGVVLGRLRHGRIGRFLRAHPTLVDGALAIPLSLFAFAALLNTLQSTSGAREAATIVIAAAGVIPLIWRRRFPAAVFAACFVAGVLQLFVGRLVESNLGVPVAFYTVASLGTRRERIGATVAVAVGVVLGSMVWHQENRASIAANLVLLGLVAVTSGVLGRNKGTRRAYLAALTDRADRLERERDQQAQIAAAAERARIAREMHDIVAHNLSVMIALADGAQFALAGAPSAGSPSPRSGEGSPGSQGSPAGSGIRESVDSPAVQAITQVSRTGREALAEMRRLLGVLRSDGAPDGTAPQPGLTDLDSLIDQVRQAGLPVSLTVHGKPLDLPAGVALTLYRLVQEALTNTLKHAGPGATASVRLAYDRRGISVDVQDTGRGGTVPLPAHPDRQGHDLGENPCEDAGQDRDRDRDRGQGLVGMRERIAVYGGTVRAGPGADGGWQVRARITLSGITGGARNTGSDQTAGSDHTAGVDQDARAADQHRGAETHNHGHSPAGQHTAGNQPGAGTAGVGVGTHTDLRGRSGEKVRP